MPRTIIGTRIRSQKSVKTHTHGINNMCRNIKPLHNFEPPATQDEIRLASLQFVRKISGSTKPSSVNAVVFEKAVDDISLSVAQLLNSLTTSATPRDRQQEALKAKDRAQKRFGTGR